jgi:hypothetical protein
MGWFWELKTQRRRTPSTTIVSRTGLPLTSAGTPTGRRLLMRPIVQATAGLEEKLVDAGVDGIPERRWPYALQVVATDLLQRLVVGAELRRIDLNVLGEATDARFVLRAHRRDERLGCGFLQPEVWRHAAARSSSMTTLMGRMSFATRSASGACRCPEP